MISVLIKQFNYIFQWKTDRYDLFKYGDVLVVCMQEVCEDTKEVIRIRISKKNKITSKITTEFPNKKQKPISISDNNTCEAIANTINVNFQLHPGHQCINNCHTEKTRAYLCN